MPKHPGAVSRVLKDPSQRRSKVAARCIVCNRPMRSAHLRVAEWPGTVRAHGRGKCQPCVRKEPSTRPTAVRGGELSHDMGALGYRPIAGPTAEQERLMLRQVSRMAVDDADAMSLTAMLLGPMRQGAVASPASMALLDCADEEEEEECADDRWGEE
jgi:hypothetical protein